MNNLVPIKFENQNVITTELLAEVYGTDTANIRNNFKRNKDNFEEGKHYYLLEGKELKDFKATHLNDEYLRNKDEVTESYLVDEQVKGIGLVDNCLNNNQLVGKRASSLYLWTERGANRHCKILDTDKAWEQFDNLEETYFKVKENPSLNTQALSPQLQLLINIELEQKQIKQDVAENKKDLQNIRDVVALNSTNWKADSSRIISSIAGKLGDFSHIKDIRNEIYKQLEQRMACDLKRRLTNKRYRQAENGVCKSKRDKLNNLDVIADDKHLIEGYVAIVKEMAIKYGVANTLN
ncbi:ORF6N domain-containing protein [Metaclostridioides mangenotii]|uniref:ORF6N domain-containing protein n=1 Tax=Metaclostridioides mangenotii TaxID=1540 RepID=UPI0004A3B182|nr:ORF6N domain-containing protein [Clostridioides mangenotii]